MKPSVFLMAAIVATAGPVACQAEAIPANPGPHALTFLLMILLLPALRPLLTPLPACPQKQA